MKGNILWKESEEIILFYNIETDHKSIILGIY